MKKTVCFLLTIMLCICLCACNKQQGEMVSEGVGDGTISLSNSDELEKYINEKVNSTYEMYCSGSRTEKYVSFLIEGSTVHIYYNEGLEIDTGAWKIRNSVDNFVDALLDLREELDDQIDIDYQIYYHKTLSRREINDFETSNRENLGDFESTSVAQYKYLSSGQIEKADSLCKAAFDGASAKGLDECFSFWFDGERTFSFFWNKDHTTNANITACTDFYNAQMLQVMELAKETGYVLVVDYVETVDGVSALREVNGTPTTNFFSSAVEIADGLKDDASVPSEEEIAAACETIVSLAKDTRDTLSNLLVEYIEIDYDGIDTITVKYNTEKPSELEDYCKTIESLILSVWKSYNHDYCGLIYLDEYIVVPSAGYIERYVNSFMVVDNETPAREIVASDYACNVEH